MATRYNFFGGLVTDGLVLDLDAAKLSSYPAGGTAWINISGNGSNGVLNNGPTFSGVGKQAAIVFDGVDDYVAGPYFSSLPIGSSDRSFGVWFKTSKVLVPTNYENFIYYGEAASNKALFVSIGNEGGGANFGNGVHFGASQYGNAVATTFDVNDNTWRYGVVTVNNGLWSIYMNGVLNNSKSMTTNTTASNWLVGAAYADIQTPYQGSLSVVQIYNRSISPFEISQNFNAYKSRYGIPDIVTDGLILNLDAGNPYSYYSPTSGTTWTDVSGSGNNGTLTNGPVYSNGAITFDGVDDYASISGLANTHSSSSLTLEAWVTVGNSYSYYAGIFGKGTSDNDEEYCLLYNKFSNKIYMDVGNSGGPYIDATYTLALNTVYHIVGTHVRTGGVSTLTIYVNGSFVSNTTAANTNPVNVNSYSTTIGSRFQNGVSSWNGKIYNTKIYNKVLSQEEITQNYSALRGRYGV